MSESDEPRQDSEEGDLEHPLKEGIDAAMAGDTASIEDILSELD